MGKVVAYNNEGVVDDAHSIRDIRNDFGLSITQAAAALRTSAATVELWEANPGMGPSPVRIKNLFEHYLRNNDPSEAANLLFRQYPLRLAREILKISVEDLASQFNYTKSTWQKFESNTRLLNSDDIGRLEKMVRDRFALVCSVS